MWFGEILVKGLMVVMQCFFELSCEEIFDFGKLFDIIGGLLVNLLLFLFMILSILFIVVLIGVVGVGGISFFVEVVMFKLLKMNLFSGLK